MDEREVIERAAVRTAMDDPTYFVGRSVEQRRLSASKVAWIFGPARIGKSGLARRLCERDGDLVIWEDASDLGPRDFDQLLRRVVKRAGRDVPLPSGDPRDVFTALAESSCKRRVRVVFDEFDRLAMHLGIDEQTFLRKLAHEHDGFSLVIVTRLDPARLVEEFSAPASRLLGISVQQILPALEKRDVQGLFDRIARDLTRPGFSRWAGYVWERVGGHPISVMTLAHALACREIDDELDEGLAVDTLDRHHDEVRTQLVSLWRDLKLGTRFFLLAKPGQANEEHQRAALLDGYRSARGDIRPAWLLAVGQDLGLVATAAAQPAGDGVWARAERIDELVYSVNTKTKRLVGFDFFESTNESNARYVLGRLLSSEQDFGGVVGHLHKRLYEGARIPAELDPSGKPQTKWRMPGSITEAWRGSRGLQTLCVLRNHQSHDQNRNFTAGQSNKDYIKAGDVLLVLCGSRAPTSAAEWNRARDGMLDEVLAGLEATDAAATTECRSGV
jgi:hypothetical protein